MILASFVASLPGVAGRQVRYQNPQTPQHTLSIALSVTEAEKQEIFSETFLRSLTSQSTSKPGRPVVRTLRDTALGAQLTHALVNT